MPQDGYPFDTSPATVGRWARMARTFAPSGILRTGTGTTDYAVTWNGLTASFAPGVPRFAAWVTGFMHELSTTPVTFTVPANTATTARVDRFVLRRDLATQSVLLTHVMGTPAASPAPPPLLADPDAAVDLPLWSFTVPANSGTVVSGVTDERQWLDPNGGPRGVLKETESNASALTSSTAEARLAGPQNMAVYLQPGRAYVANFAALVGSTGGPGTAQLVLRGALGVTPTVNSPALFASRVYVSAAGAPGQITLPATGRAFTVATAGTWNISTFAVIINAAGATGFGFIAVSIAGQSQMTVTDVGAAGPDIPVITSAI